MHTSAVMLENIIVGRKATITVLMAKHHGKKNTIYAAATDETHERVGYAYDAPGGAGMGVDSGIVRAGLVGADGSMSCELRWAG
jgi:hypothetical protein